MADFLLHVFLTTFYTPTLSSTPGLFKNKGWTWKILQLRHSWKHFLVHTQVEANQLHRWKTNAVQGLAALRVESICHDTPHSHQYHMAAICHESLIEMLQRMQSQKMPFMEFILLTSSAFFTTKFLAHLKPQSSQHIPFALHTWNSLHPRNYSAAMQRWRLLYLCLCPCPCDRFFWPTVTVRTSKSSTNQAFTVTTARSSQSNKEARSSMDRCKLNSIMPAPQIYVCSIPMLLLNHSFTSNKYFFLIYFQTSVHHPHCANSFFHTSFSTTVGAARGAIAVRCRFRGDAPVGATTSTSLSSAIFSVAQHVAACDTLRANGLRDPAMSTCPEV